MTGVNDGVIREKDNECLSGYLNEGEAKAGHIEKLETACRHYCYVISYSETKHMLYIPYDVRELNSIRRGYSIQNSEVTSYLMQLQGDMQVIGRYAQLRDISKLFYECSFDSLDLSQLNTKTVVDASQMFSRAKVPVIDISHLDFSKASTIWGMFSDCVADKIIIGGVKTPNVLNMSLMFDDCDALLVGLDKLDTHSVLDMEGMFRRYKKPLNSFSINYFDMSNVHNVAYMFSCCQIQRLKISFKDMRNISDMHGMFNEYRGAELLLGGLNSKHEVYMWDMFNGSNITNLGITNFNLSKVRDTSTVFHNSNISNFKTDNIQLRQSYSSRNETEAERRRRESMSVADKAEEEYFKHTGIELQA